MGFQPHIFAQNFQSKNFAWKKNKLLGRGSKNDHVFFGAFFRLSPLFFLPIFLFLLMLPLFLSIFTLFPPPSIIHLFSFFLFPFFSMFSLFHFFHPNSFFLLRFSLILPLFAYVFPPPPLFYYIFPLPPFSISFSSLYFPLFFRLLFSLFNHLFPSSPLYYLSSLFFHPTSLLSIFPSFS